MTYTPKAIDFTDHVATYECNHRGHGLCGDCPDELNRRHPTTSAPTLPSPTTSPRSWTRWSEQERIDAVDAALCGAPYQPMALARYVAEYGFVMIGTREATEMVAVRVAKTAVELESALEDLLDAFPRLGKDYSEARQQEALRAARKAVGR